MLSVTPPRRWLLVIQFWLSLCRLSIVLYGSVVISYEITAIEESLVSESDHAESGTMVLLSFQLGTCIILVLNDIYIMAVDFIRTNTYIGCIVAQVGLSLYVIVFTVTSLLIRRGWGEHVILSFGEEGVTTSILSGPDGLTLVLPAVFGAVSSLCLLVIMLWSAFSHHPCIPLKRAWKYNNKDLLVGAADLHSTPNTTLSIVGQPRTALISAKREIYAPGNTLGRFLAQTFFRRVSPAETRMYAMTRNIFALASIFILIFRAIVALGRAQNQIGTRMASGSCDPDRATLRGEGTIYNLQLIVTHDPFRYLSVYPLTTITLSYNGSTTNCEVHGNQTDYRGRIFDCETPIDPPVGFFSRDVTLRIEVRSANGVALHARDMPDVWVSTWQQEINETATPSNHHRNVPGSLIGRAAWAYIPPWSLRPGFHIEAEAQYIIRRFINSSLIRELIFNSSPTYKREFLFPIVESGMASLPNDTLATATLRPTLRPGFAYLRGWQAYRDLSNIEQIGYYDGLCTFIEDYREGSVFDVLGSIGGLFALLQSAHVLLFGRPMLWGITGAKLITPFGLLGAFSSQGFRRRLRAQYYTQPTEDNPETFLMGAFLRDFVVDLGPAEVNRDQVQARSSSIQASSTTVVNRNGKLNDCQIPLMRLELQRSPSFERMIDVEELSSRARERAENSG